MRIVIRDGMRGLLFRAGKLVRVLEPGAHRIHPFLRGEAVELVDVRERAIQLDLAPLLTRDRVPVGVTGFASYRIADPRALLRIGNVATRLELEARAAVAGAVAQVDALALAPALRGLASDVQDRLTLEMRPMGVEVVSVGLMGVRYPRRLRRMLKSKEVFERMIGTSAAAPAGR